MSYPQRSGEPDCRDFLRTGRCKYGDSCKYHHPLGGVKTTDPNEPPFPIRPDEPLCQYFLKNGTCKFGQTCKFHHPAHMIGKARALNPFTTPGISGVGVGTTKDSPNSNHPSAHMQEIRNTNDFGVVLPQRPHEPDCIYFLKHGRCKYGATCKYHHPGNVNTRCVPVSNPRYVSHSNPSASALYEVSSSRGRSASNGSMTEVRDSLSQGTFLRGSGSGAPSAHVNVYQSIGIEQGKLVDSVPHPQRPRNETLETISNTYNPYSHSQHSQRFPKNSTPDDSPTLGSPSVTSSTIASSYDTAVLSIEKLPQALSQHQNSNIRRTLSSNSHHSRANSFSEYDGALAFDDVGAGPTNSYEQTQSQSRISNIRHSSSYQPQPMPAPNNNYSHHHYDMEEYFPPTHANNRTLSMDNSMFQPSTGTSAGIGPSPYGNGDRSIYHQERQVNVNRDRDMLNNVRRGSVDNTVVRPHAVDDGLSMMTSALLTMLDAPWTGNGPGNVGHENADTISTHSSNFEDNSNCNLPLSSHTHTNQDLPFISRSLPEYGSSQPIGISSGIPNQRRDTLLNLRQPSQSANVNVPYQFALNQGQQLQSNQNGNGNNGNGFHNNNQLQSQSQQLRPIPSHASDQHLHNHNPDPGRGPRRNSFHAPLYNNNAPATSTYFNNLGIVSAVAKPSPAADNLRRHGHPGAIGNPNPDTVNRNGPFTQFPLAP